MKMHLRATTVDIDDRGVICRCARSRTASDSGSVCTGCACGRGVGVDVDDDDVRADRKLAAAARSVDS